jgi:hypothetical protein
VEFHAKFERRHELAIAALLKTTSVSAAAKASGVGERTLRRWLDMPEFQAAYRRARRELISGAVHALLQATSSATDTLIAIMQDADQPATARVSAARTILQMVLRALNDDNVHERLSEMERLLAEAGHPGFNGNGHQRTPTP